MDIRFILKLKSTSTIRSYTWEKKETVPWNSQIRNEFADQLGVDHIDGHEEVVEIELVIHDVAMDSTTERIIQLRVIL